VPGLSDVVRALLGQGGGGLCSQPVPAQFVGLTFGELLQALRSRQGFLALAIVTESKGLALDDLLTDDYSLVDQFIKKQFRQAGVDYLRFGDTGVRVVVSPPDSYPIGESDTVVGVVRAE
jgi:hypothetical protein